jgi:SM-20-related protein
LYSTAAVAEFGDSIFDFAALDAAVLEREPFDFVVVPKFVRGHALATAIRDFPRITGPANYSPDGLTFGPGFSRILETLIGDEFAAMIGAKFDLELVGYPTTITVRKYCEASDGNIHTDHRSKIITVLLYFNTEWPHDGGRLRMLRSAKDIDDYAAEVPPLGGTLLVFRRTDNSYHGHKRFVGERRMLQLNWLKQSRKAQYHQKFDRFCTHLLKRASRLGQ